MSHFTVLVVGNDIDGQLAAYDGNLETDARREHLAEEEVERMAEHYKIDPTDLAALSEKMDDWRCCPGGVDTKGLYVVSTYNDDAKWDWYEVGGRWSGFLKLKDGAEGEYGNSRRKAAFGEAPQQEAGFADSARKSDIDFDGMRSETEKDARETWRLYRAAVAGTPPHTPAKAYRPRIERGELTADDARLEYGQQPRVKAFRDARDLNERLGYFASPDDFPDTEAEYVARRRAESTTTFAYVKGGEWHDQGDTGWWGTVANKKEPEVWAAEFNAMLESLPDDEMLTVIDCHI